MGSMILVVDLSDSAGHSTHANNNFNISLYKLKYIYKYI
jgi:hypothetical protein